MTFIQFYYMFRLSISAISRYEYWFTKRVNGETPLLTNIGYKNTAKFIIIIPKME